jgi:hypothetical protein
MFAMQLKTDIWGGGGNKEEEEEERKILENEMRDRRKSR